MTDKASDDNTGSTDPLVDMDDLEKFEEVFFQRETEEKEIETSETEDQENEDDALETSEDESDDAEDDISEEDEQPEEEEEEAPPPPKKAKKSAKERIDEITAEKYEIKRQLDEALRKLESRSTEVEKKEEAPAPDVRSSLSDEAPNPDAKDDEGEPLYPLGEFDPRFIRDLTRFTIAQETAAAKAELERERVAKEAELTAVKLNQEWNEKLEEAEKEIPELRENLQGLVETFKGLEPAYGEFLAGTIMQMDNGPQIMNYLSQNIGEAQKIVASGPVAATLAIGKLDAILARDSKEEEKKSNSQKVKASSAPEPPKERARGSNGQFAIPGDTDDLDAFEKEFFKKKRF